jgi:uncharacterized protein
MHALRLGVQGIELMTTGQITLPVPEPDRQYLRAIRRGEVPQAEVVAAVESAERELEVLRASSAIAAEPDRNWVRLHRSHTHYWSALDPSAPERP